MHVNLKSGLLLLFISLSIFSCERSVSPYKMELKDNEIACLINRDLFNGELVFSRLTKFDGYYQLEMDAFTGNNSIHWSVISDDDQFVGKYYFDKKSFNGVSYSTNSFKYLQENPNGKDKLFSSDYCEESVGEVEITNFNMEQLTCSGFIHSKICHKDKESGNLEQLNVSECRFFNITFELIHN